MGLLDAYYRFKEHLRIHRFKFGEEISRQKIFWELFRNRWRSFLTLFALVIVCFILDILYSDFLVPFIIQQPWHASLNRFIQFPSNDIIIGLLGAVIQGVAAIIGLLLSISLVVLELAAINYPTRMVRFLIEEKVGAYITDFLTTTLLFSIWTLFLLQRGTSIPYVSIFVNILLASASIVFLFAYRKYSLYFFQPRQGFMVASNDVKRRFYTIFEKGSRLGRSVTTHLQEIVQERILLMKDFLKVLLKKKDSEAVYGLLELASILSSYIENKRFINVQGGWFPSRDVPVYEEDYALGLVQIREELALGPSIKQEPNTDWLEIQILDIIYDAQRKAIEESDRNCLYAIILAYRKSIEKCFEHQEFSILDSIIKQVSDFCTETAVKGFPEVDRKSVV